MRFGSLLWVDGPFKGVVGSFFKNKRCRDVEV